MWKNFLIILIFLVGYTYGDIKINVDRLNFTGQVTQEDRYYFMYNFKYIDVIKTKFKNQTLYNIELSSYFNPIIDKSLVAITNSRVHYTLIEDEKDTSKVKSVKYFAHLNNNISFYLMIRPRQSKTIYKIRFEEIPIWLYTTNINTLNFSKSLNLNDYNKFLYSIKYSDVFKNENNKTLEEVQLRCYINPPINETLLNIDKKTYKFIKDETDISKVKYIQFNNEKYTYTKTDYTISINRQPNEKIYKFSFEEIPIWLYTTNINTLNFSKSLNLNDYNKFLYSIKYSDVFKNENNKTLEEVQLRCYINPPINETLLNIDKKTYKFIKDETDISKVKYIQFNNEKYTYTKTDYTISINRQPNEKIYKFSFEEIPIWKCYVSNVHKDIIFDGAVQANLSYSLIYDYELKDFKVGVTLYPSVSSNASEFFDKCSSNSSFCNLIKDNNTNFIKSFLLSPEHYSTKIDGYNYYNYHFNFYLNLTKEPSPSKKYKITFHATASYKLTTFTRVIIAIIYFTIALINVLFSFLINKSIFLQRNDKIDYFWDTLIEILFAAGFLLCHYYRYLHTFFGFLIFICFALALTLGFLKALVPEKIKKVKEEEQLIPLIIEYTSLEHALNNKLKQLVPTLKKEAVCYHFNYNYKKAGYKSRDVEIFYSNMEVETKIGRGKIYQFEEYDYGEFKNGKKYVGEEKSIINKSNITDKSIRRIITESYEYNNDKRVTYIYNPDWNENGKEFKQIIYEDGKYTKKLTVKKENGKRVLITKIYTDKPSDRADIYMGKEKVYNQNIKPKEKGIYSYRIMLRNKIEVPKGKIVKLMLKCFLTIDDDTLSEQRKWKEKYSGSDKNCSVKYDIILNKKSLIVEGLTTSTGDSKYAASKSLCMRISHLVFFTVGFGTIYDIFFGKRKVYERECSDEYNNKIYEVEVLASEMHDLHNSFYNSKYDMCNPKFTAGDETIMLWNGETKK